MRFQGTKNYIATEDLKLAVDAALNLEKPLLVKGEPGTGKTMLAVEVAKSLGLRLLNGTLNLQPKLHKVYTSTMQYQD